MKNKTISKVSLLAILGMLAGTSIAQVKVNSATITEDFLQARVDLAVKQGNAKDTPELRKVIREDQINRELVVQEAIKGGLDKSASTKVQLELAKQNLLIDLYFRDYFAKNPITDAEIKAQYDMDLKAITSKSSDEYKLRLIVAKDKVEADLVAEKLAKKESFDVLAKQHSVDATKSTGGSLNWILPAQLQPEIADAILKMNKNTTSAPIKISSGWAIVRVEDKRSYKPQTLEQVKPRIIQILMAKKRNQVMSDLRQKAVIK